MSSPLFVSPSRPGEPPCSYRMLPFSSPSLWVFRSLLLFRPQVCGMGAPSLHRCSVWRRCSQESAEHALSRKRHQHLCRTAPGRTGSFSPAPLSSTLCVLHLLTGPGWLPEVITVPRPTPRDPLLLFPHCV